MMIYIKNNFQKIKIYAKLEEYSIKDKILEEMLQ